MRWPWLCDALWKMANYRIFVRGDLETDLNKTHTSISRRFYSVITDFLRECNFRLLTAMDFAIRFTCQIFRYRLLSHFVKKHNFRKICFEKKLIQKYFLIDYCAKGTASHFATRMYRLFFIFLLWKLLKRVISKTHSNAWFESIPPFW